MTKAPVLTPIRHTTHKITVPELERMYPEETLEIIELLEGEIIVSNTPKPLHQATSARLVTFINMVVLSNDLGEMQHAPSEVYFDSYNSLQPDIFSWLRRDQNVSLTRIIAGMVRPIIEIFVLQDDRYQRQGVYDEQDTLTSAVLPQLTLAVSQIFPKTI